MAIYAELAVRPTVAEVAHLMPDRTALPTTGELAGTFTTLTVPTSEQVDAIIDMVLDAFDPRISESAVTENKRAVRAIITLQAAILTEVTHFSDQGAVSTERIGVWERLAEQHTTAILGSTEDATEASNLVAGNVQNGVIVVRQLLP